MSRGGKENKGEHEKSPQNAGSEIILQFGQCVYPDVRILPKENGH